MLQWNIIDELLIYVWPHLLRNISYYSWRLLVTKYLQPFPLFCRSPLTKILNFNSLRLPSYWFVAFYTSMHGVTGSPSFWSSIKKVWLLIIFFIYLRVAFRQGFFMFSDNFVTSAKFLGSGMKWETSEPDSPKGVNSCGISLTAVENSLCKPFPVLRVAFNSPFHSGCLCLIRSRIL